MTSLLGVAYQEHLAAIDDYIADEVVQEDMMVLPAFHPVITPRDEDWKDFHVIASHAIDGQPVFSSESA